MSELAATYVRIRPRTSGFKSEADAQLQREKPGDVSVGITTDTTRADSDLRAFSGKLDALRLKTATVSIDISDRAATAKMTALDAALNRLDRLRATPTVDVDGIARAEAEVESLNLQLDRLSERRVSAGGAGGGILGRLAGFGQGGFFGGRGLAIGALGSAAVPLGVAGAGLGASFLTPTVAGTAGLGLFGAASRSSFTRVDKVQTQLEALEKRIAATPATIPAGSPAQITAAQLRLQAAEQSLARAQVSNPLGTAGAQASVLSAQSSLARAQGGGANPAHDKLIQQRQQLLNSLTPAEKAAADGLEKLDQTWVHFQRQLEPQSFKLLATGTDIFTKGLRVLLPMTKAVGDEVDHLAKRADVALSDPFWHHFFGDFLTKEAPRAVDSLFTSVGNVVTGIAHLSEQWAPLGHNLERDFVTITARFDTWSQGQGPLKFMALVQRDGPLAAQAVSGIASAFVGLANGLEPIGRIELQALSPVLHFVGELGKEHPEVITALGAAYLSVAIGLKAVAAVKGLSGIGGALGGVKAGGKGGILGGILGSAGVLGGSPAHPLYVVVINKGTSSSGPLTTVEKDAEHAGEATLGARVLRFGRSALRRSAAAAGLYFAGDAVQAVVPGHAGSFIGNSLKGASVGYEIGGPPGAVTLGAGTAALQGVGSALSWASASDARNQAKAQAAVIAQLMANGRGEANLAKLHQIAANQMKDTGRVAGEVSLEINLLTKALNAQKGAATGATGANSALRVALKKIGDGSYAAGEDIGTNLGRGLIAGIDAQIPHATVAGKLLVASTAKQMRLSAEADQRSAVSIIPKPEKVKQQATDTGTAIGSGLASGITAAAPVVSTAVTNLVARIQARLQAAGATEQQLTASLLGQTGLSGFSAQTDALGNPVAPTTAGILGGLRHQKLALTTLRTRLHRESEHGLSTGAEQQIIGLGLGQGGAYAASLSHASRVQLRSISRLLGDIHGEAAGTARDVTAEIYGQKITSLLQALNETVKNNPQSKQIIAELRHLTNQLDALGLEVRGAQHKAMSRTSH